MYLFQQEIGIAGGYNELWKWSIENSDEFWTKLMDFLEVELSGSLTPVKEGEKMPDVNYFPNVRVTLLKTSSVMAPLIRL